MMEQDMPTPSDAVPARPRPIRRGTGVLTADGVSLGRVMAVEGDHLVVDGGGILPDLARLPTALIAGIDAHCVHLTVPAAALSPSPPGTTPPTTEDAQQTLELREERLVPHTERRDVGEVRIRTVVEEVPGRLEVEGRHDEVVVEHVPIGREVAERAAPREEGDVLVVPVYEEQLVVSRRLVLREELHIHRYSRSERRLFEDTLRREQVEIEDAARTGWVRERYPTEDGPDDAADERPDDDPLTQLVKRVFQ